MAWAVREPSFDSYDSDVDTYPSFNNDMKIAAIVTLIGGVGLLLSLYTGKLAVLSDVAAFVQEGGNIPTLISSSIIVLGGAALGTIALHKYALTHHVSGGILLVESSDNEGVWSSDDEGQDYDLTAYNNREDCWSDDERLA